MVDGYSCSITVTSVQPTIQVIIPVVAVVGKGRRERKVLENGKALENRKVLRKKARAVVHEWRWAVISGSG